MSRQLIILAISVTLSVLVASALAGEIHDAARSGDLERVEAILANDPHLVNTKDENVDTPLHLASRDGHRAVVELLLAKGAAIDAGDPASDVGVEPLPNGERINLGAYGGTLQASKSPDTIPPIP